MSGKLPERPPHSRARAVQRGSTLVMSALMIVLGIAMVTLALVRGGGPLAVGVLLGVLFVLVGAGRSYIELRRP